MYDAVAEVWARRAAAVIFGDGSLKAVATLCIAGKERGPGWRDKDGAGIGARGTMAEQWNTGAVVQGDSGVDHAAVKEHRATQAARCGQIITGDVQRALRKACRVDPWEWTAPTPRICHDTPPRLWHGGMARRREGRQQGGFAAARTACDEVKPGQHRPYPSRA